MRFLATATSLATFSRLVVPLREVMASLFPLVCGKRSPNAFKPFQSSSRKMDMSMSTEFASSEFESKSRLSSRSNPSKLLSPTPLKRAHDESSHVVGSHCVPSVDSVSVCPVAPSHTAYNHRASSGCARVVNDAMLSNKPGIRGVEQHTVLPYSSCSTRRPEPE